MLNRIYILMLIIVICYSQLAKAQTNVGMNFEISIQDFRHMGLDLFQIIHAKGQITDGTSNELEKLAKENNLIPGGVIYLESEGGSLLEGIKLGETIRKLGLNTYVGGGKNKISYCLSACALAFLGGKSRVVMQESVYGVHRFYQSKEPNPSSADIAQILSAVIISYIETMGVKSELFNMMASAGKNEIFVVNDKDLARLNITNDGVWRNSWEIDANEAGVLLRGTLENDRGLHKMTFTCIKNELFGVGLLDSPAPTEVVNLKPNGLMVDDEQITINSPSVTNNSYVILPYKITPRLEKIILSSKKLGIFFLHTNEQMFAGFQIAKNDADNALIENFFNNCRR